MDCFFPVKSSGRFYQRKRMACDHQFLIRRQNVDCNSARWRANQRLASFYGAIAIITMRSISLVALIHINDWLIANTACSKRAMSR
jgi:hypothetical protein